MPPAVRGLGALRFSLAHADAQARIRAAHGHRQAHDDHDDGDGHRPARHGDEDELGIQGRALLGLDATHGRIRHAGALRPGGVAAGVQCCETKTEAGEQRRDVGYRVQAGIDIRDEELVTVRSG